MLNNYRLVYAMVATVLLLIMDSSHVQCFAPGHFQYLKQFQHENSLSNLLNTIEIRVRNGRIPYLSERDVQLLSFLVYDINKQKSTNKTPPQFWHSRQGR